MKKKWMLLAGTFAACIWMSFAQSVAAGDVTAQFTDAAFRAAVQARVGSVITSEACESIRELKVSRKGIQSMAGLSCFKNLRELDCSDNALTRIDLTGLPLLTELDVENNQLTSLDLSGNPLLEELDCSKNNLTSLDVRKNLALEELDCEYNLMASRDAILSVHTIPELDFSPQKAAVPGVSPTPVPAENLYLTLTITEKTLYKDTAAAWRKVALEARTNAGETVKYKSSNKKVATVTSQGVVKAKKKGTCTITAYLSGHPQVKAICEITVKKPTLKLSLSELTLKVGKKAKIEATVVPTAKLSYESENKKVAKVSKSGVITAKKVGTARIEVEANDVEKTILVHVVE